MSRSSTRKGSHSNETGPSGRFRADQRNSFGSIIPERKTIMENPRWVDYIHLTLDNFIAALGVQPHIRPVLLKRLLEAARTEGDDAWYEETAHSMLRRATSDPEWKQALADRVGRIFDQIKAHLRPGPTLDYGCGSGGGTTHRGTSRRGCSCGYLSSS